MNLTLQAVLLSARSCVLGSLVCVLLASTLGAQNNPTFDTLVNGPIHALLVQPDGKLLLGGEMTSLSGATRNYLGRLNADGSLDTSFNPGANAFILCAALQTNGQMLVAGHFTELGGQIHNYLARLNADGTLDATFTAGTDADVTALAVQADGKIVVGGYFSTIAGQPRNTLGRLNPDGSLDASFNAGAGGAVHSLAVQPDGKIVVGGWFFDFGGIPVNFVCRLNASGALDTNFVASLNSLPFAIAVQADGRILLGGPFTSVNGQPRTNLARLNADGTLDAAFTNGVSPPGYSSDVLSLAVQSDGKILVGGKYSELGGQPRANLTRLNADGSLDSAFNPGITNRVSALVLQRDGKILCGTDASLTRLTNSPATESLTYTNSTITWLRGGGSPEVWRTTFESSTNFSNWVSVGAGTRVGGGWQRTGVSAPTNAYIRARGFVASGMVNGSLWYVEAYSGRPVILSQPSSRTNIGGTTATFTALADGSPTLTYRWRRNGTNLTNTGNVSGVTNATLVLTNVMKADAAPYSLLVSNRFGAITSAVVNLTVIDPVIVTQPADQFVRAGDDAHFIVTAAGSATLKFQWLRNGLTLAGQTNAALTLTNVQGADAGSAFRVVVTNSGGALTSAVASLTVNVATVDSLNPAPNYPVRSLAIQPDGKLLLSGYFSWVGNYLRVGIARLNADGSMDTNFVAGISGIPFSPSLPLVAVQEDGKILLAGGIGWANNVPRNQIARFLPDGTLDLAFNPDANADVYAMALQADGKIVLGGSFTNLGGAFFNHLGRLNSDGSPDTNFVSGVNGTVSSLAVQPDGKLLVGGSFVALGATPVARTNLGRLNSDGSVDAGFTPAADGPVNALALQTNASILVGGNFTTLGGQARTNLGRLNSSGVLDAAFVPGANGAVNTIVVQTDGKIAVGGNFTMLAGQPRNYLGRLNTNGTPDMTFRPEADAAVNSLALQPDGKLVAGGDFTMLDGQPRAHLGRLNSTTSAAQNLTYNLGTITWLRSGAGPEVSHVFFDASTNGTSLFRLSATRVAGGWQASGPSLPANATVRARGWIAGSGDGSSWFAESVIGPALIERQPASRTNDALTMATLDIMATGQQPLSLQWLKNGVPLTDGTNFLGALTPTLTFNSVLGSEAGAYRCVVSNAFGSVTSVVATLTVRDPLFTGHPMDHALNAGNTAEFWVSAIGSTPLDYYWLKNGVPLTDGTNISGAHSTMLTVANVLGGDAGAYRAVATNVWGSATSAVATLTVVDPLLTASPTSQSAQRGQTVTFNVSVTGTQPLAYQWRHDGALLPGGTASSLVLTNVQWADVGAYDVIATNNFGSVTSAVATLAVNVAIVDGFNPGANDFVLALAERADGRILVGGSFTNLGGQAHLRLGQLNPDGSADAAFIEGANNTVRALAIQTNGQILVAGEFILLAGQYYNYLGRLTAAGTTDFSFPNPYADYAVRCLALQADGQILVGGLFNQMGGQPRGHLARLSSAGVLDDSFAPVVSGGDVLALAIQPDGKILVAGSFTNINGETCRGMARLNPDGTLDAGFSAAVEGAAYVILVQPDGKIVVGGQFTGLSRGARTNLGRLNVDGSLDTSFAADATDSPYPWVYSLALQADGKISVGGLFNALSGQPRHGLGRLNADGTVDASFNPGEGWVWIYAQALQGDGKLVVGGWFTSLAGQPRTRLARIASPEPATGSLTFDSSTITWNRGGTATEVWRTTFDFSTNGLNWIELGAGARIPGGWQITGQNLPSGTIVRGRGFVVGGNWFVETIGGLPLVVTQPANRTNNAGTVATFSVAALGATPINYQWLKNGNALGNGGNISGATNATLTLTNVFGADAGGYSVILSNASGSVTSAVATLTVVDPLITGQPAGQAVSAGQSATFTVTALASLPLSYQWRRQGTLIGGATNSTLALTNVQRADAGNYTVVLSNQFRVVTSSPAPLAVNLALADAFNPGSGGTVSQLMPQPDGKILAAGIFGPANNRKYLARFNPDGLPDPTFLYSNVVVDVSSTYCLALQPDGRILGSGLGRQQLPTTLWRLMRDGTVDASFTNQISGAIYGLALLPDGRAWAGGSFTYNKPATLTNLALVQANGAVDTNFAAAINGAINCLALQPDGQLLAGGSFTLINGRTATRLSRLSAVGVWDTNFNGSASSTVIGALVQPDGKIVISINFAASNGQRLARLNPDGSVEAAFNPNPSGNVLSMALQTDGRIVIAGTFTSVSGQPRNRLARLNPDGSLDPTFDPNANGTVYALGLQADGALVVAGSFSILNGQYRTNLARLVATDPAVQVLTYSAATLDWARSGTCPEVWRTTFEMSTNGTDWLPLGNGSRVAGGWQLTGVALPTGAYARARGFLTAGQNNAASWFVESGFGPPLVTAQPVSRTNLAATVATFPITVEGTAPLSYQWRKGGVALTDGGSVSGARTSMLALSNVFGADAGLYSVIISNVSGVVTSSVAALTVIEPVITSQPVSVYTNAGQIAAFSVSAVGTAPTYQWLKNGTNLPAATTTALVLTNCQKNDIASYSVVVTSAFGVVTSAVANLTLNLALPDALQPAINDEVRSLALQPDGKILIGGNFNMIGSNWVLDFGRLNPDGSLDTNFIGHTSSSTDTIAVQPDGNILAGGWFTYVNDWPHSRICRFYPDGNLDPAINPTVTSSTLNPFIDSLVPQPDRKFLVGGWFTSLASQSRSYLGRFNADGTLDSFNPGANTHVMVLALQPDGKVIASGNFTTLGGQTRNRIGRLNPDGTLDMAFDPNANSTVNAVVLQPDGRILIAGSFTTITNQSRSYLARLNSDGTVDPTLNVALNGGVSSIALQADGAIILAGGFTTVAGQARSGLARVSATGALDANWSPLISGGGVGGICIQPDGKILICGSFTSVVGQDRLRLARLEATTPAEHRLVCDAVGISWLRGGASPEVWGVKFELSADGTNWTSLGVGSRITGGWRANTAALAVGAFVRAHGFATGGRWTGSLSLIEDVAQVSPLTPPWIDSTDASFGYHTNQFGFTLRALPGQQIVIEAATNLAAANWLPLSTNMITATPLFFGDPASTNLPLRFYRARVH